MSSNVSASLLTDQIPIWIERYLDDANADDPMTRLIQRSRAEANYHRARHNHAYPDGMAEVAGWFEALLEAYRTTPISYELAARLAGITTGAVRNKVSNRSFNGGGGMVMLGSISLPPERAPDTHGVIALERARTANNARQEVDDHGVRQARVQRMRDKQKRRAG